MLDLTLERLRTLPVRRTDEVWEVGVVPLPVLIPESGTKAAARPVVAACVSSLGGAAMSELASQQDLPSSAMVDAVAKFALDSHVPGARPLGYLPQRMRTLRPSGDAAVRFEAAMRSLGIAVEVAAGLPTLDEFAEFLGRKAAELVVEADEAPVLIPGLLRAKGMTIERGRAFADAAAEFYRAKPWRRFPDEVLWRVEPKPKTRALSHFTVMGGAGEVFGLGFVSTPMDMMRMMIADDPGRFVQSHPATLWAMTFGGLEEMPPEDVRLWQSHGLAVASPEAYPIPSGLTPAGRVLRPSPAQLTYMEGLMRAASRLTLDDARNGGATLEVPVFEGSRVVTLRAVMGPVNASER